MHGDRAHKYDLDWGADVFTLPRYCFDADRPHVVVEYDIPSFTDAGGYTVWKRGATVECVVDTVQADTAKRWATRTATEIGGPILTPVQRVAGAATQPRV